MNADAERLITVTERLAARIEAETEALKQRRPAELETGETEKAELASAYAREAARAKKDKAAFAALPETLRARLRASAERLMRAVSAQTALLETLRSVSEGFVRAVAEEVAAKRQKTAAYGPGARTAPPKSPQAFALDRAV